MALHDTDKNSDDRATPSPNSDDNVSNRMSHETNSTTYRTAGLGVNQGLLFKQGVIKSQDAAGLTNVFFGYDPTINATRPVLRVAKDGYDAITATDDQLVFNSDQNVFKIVGTGTATFPSNPTTSAANQYAVGSVSTSIAHGLSFIPVVIAVFNDSSTYIPLPFTQFGGSGTTASWDTWFAYTDATNVTFQLNTLVFNGTHTPGGQSVRYYLLQETAN